MGISAKAKSKSNNSGNSSENWGMGLLLVFFPEENSPIVDKNKLLISSPSSPSVPSSSSSSSSSSPPKPSFKRSSASSVILSKAQSTISICALFVFITLLLFTLSTFEPSTTSRLHPTSPRRFLSNKPSPNYNQNTKTNISYHDSALPSSSFSEGVTEESDTRRKAAPSPTALQGMGILYRRGTKAMNDLVVAHVVEDVTEEDFRLFSRALHRSGLTARADIVFIFASSSVPARFGSVIQEENDSFFKLIHHYKKQNSSAPKQATNFDVTNFLRSTGKKEKKEMAEPIWGKRQRSNNSTSGGGEAGPESTGLSYGSVVGFEASELDAENSLAGFLDHVPLRLRRWACYPMLLGRLRRNFKHVMLVDVKNSFVLGDPLGRVRNRNPLSVHLSTKSESSPGKHGKKNSDKSKSHNPVNSAVIMGGARGVRRLSNAMVTEIVRAAMQHKKKNSVFESGILSELVANEFILKSVDLITSPGSNPDMSRLASLFSIPSTSLSDYAVISRGNINFDFGSIIRKAICSLEVDSSIYRDC